MSNINQNENQINNEESLLNYEEFLKIIKPDEDNQKPSFWSQIPASVRYSKKITEFQKLLFSEILALSHVNYDKEGRYFCHANNNYFARVFEKNKVRISEAISNLQIQGFILCKYIYENKECKARLIYVNEDYFIKSVIPITENRNTPITENRNTPITEIVKYTSINNNNNIITSELESLVNHDAVDLENLSTPKNNILKSDSGDNQSDIQSDGDAIPSASDNLQRDGHSEPESPITENCPPPIIKNSIQKDNIQNSGVDIELQKIKQAEKQELINFKNELLKSYSRLLGRMPSELKQTETLKTEKAREELKTIFKNRKYDWWECIEYAERKVEKHDYDFRWYNFLKTLKRILESGLEDGSIRFYYSAEERYYKKLESEKEFAKWEEDMKAERKREADAMGMTLEEYQNYITSENERAMSDLIATMDAKREAEKKAKNEEKPDTSELRSNEGHCINNDGNKKIIKLLKNGGIQAVYSSL